MPDDPIPTDGGNTDTTDQNQKKAADEDKPVATPAQKASTQDPGSTPIFGEPPIDRDSG